MRPGKRQGDRPAIGLSSQANTNDTAPVFPAAFSDIKDLVLTIPENGGGDYFVWFTAFLIGLNSDGAVSVTIRLCVNGVSVYEHFALGPGPVGGLPTVPPVAIACQVFDLAPGDVVQVFWQNFSVAPPYDTGGVGVGQGLGDRSLVAIML